MMRIEIHKAKGGWTWAFVARNGKQTANNEVFATRGNAIRAAKAVVMSVIRGYDGTAIVEWTKREGDVPVLTYRRIA